MAHSEVTAKQSIRQYILLTLLNLPVFLVMLPFVVVGRLDGVEVLGIGGVLLFQMNCQLAVMLRSNGRRGTASICFAAAALFLLQALFAIFLTLATRGN